MCVCVCVRVLSEFGGGVRRVYRHSEWRLGSLVAGVAGLKSTGLDWTGLNWSSRDYLFLHQAHQWRFLCAARCGAVRCASARWWAVTTL